MIEDPIARAIAIGALVYMLAIIIVAAWIAFRNKARGK
jgi:hypothetical protein